MSDGMEAVRDTLRKADEALRKANEPSDYVGSASSFKAESPPAPPNAEPQKRSPSVPPPERPSARISPVSMHDSWRSPQVPHVVPAESYISEFNTSAVPRMYSSTDGARLAARHRSLSPMRAMGRVAATRTEASTEFLSPQALEYLKRTGGDVHATQPAVRAGPVPDVQIVESMQPVSASPMVQQMSSTPMMPSANLHSGEYVQRLESEINLLRDKLHYEQHQREDIAEKFKQSTARFHQVAEDKLQLEQVFQRTLKDAEEVHGVARRLQEEQDMRLHAEAQTASLQKQLKQSHTELEESVEGIKKLTRTLQFKDDEIEDLRKRNRLEEEKASAAMERAKAQAREDVAGDVQMLKGVQEKEAAELRRRLDAATEEATREREAMRRKVEEAVAAKEALKAEMGREVERVKAEEERQKSDLRQRINDLTQADSREKQQLRERVDREKDELRQRFESSKATEDREKSDLRRKLDDALQEKDQSWRAVANLRENLQRCMADLSFANSRLKENEGRFKDRDAKLREADENKSKMLQVIEELKRALGETTDLNDAAKEELFYLRGRVRDLEERAAQPPPMPQDRYGLPGRGVSPADDYRQHRLVSPTNYDTPPIPNNLATQPDELRSDEGGSEPGYLAVDPNEIEAGVEVQM